MGNPRARLRGSDTLGHLYRRLADARHRMLRRSESRRLNRALRPIARVERKRLLAARRAHRPLFDQREAEPLVSVIIPTWNRAEILADRTIPSVLAQDYSHFEIVIVGDGCSDDTGERLAKIDDPRIRFENLAQRGVYPEDPVARHMVAGAGPSNRAEELASGKWLARLDDDEVWTSDHLSSLLRFAQDHDHEYVWGQACYEFEPGRWRAEGSDEPLAFDVPHSTMLYRFYLSCFPFDLEAWKHNLGGDRHRLRRMHLAGVWCGFLRQIVTYGPLRPGTTRPWAEAEDRA